MKTNRTRNAIIGGAALLAVVAGGGAYAIADGSKEKGKTLTQAETARAERAAIAKVSGLVLEVEYEEDHGGGYEVEMQQKDGSEVEVYLDRSFKVVGVEREQDEYDGQDREMEAQADYGSDGMDPGSGKQGGRSGK